MKSITVKNISKSFQNRTLFAAVSFTVQKGDRVAITGQNGAGKSTLLKIIAGIERCDEGTLIKEKVTCRYIPQEFSGNTSVSIVEYLDEMHATARVFDILFRFAAITEAHIENGYVHELSEGQKRILEIAAVLSHAPMFVCIDEPENHLDITARSVLTDLLQEYWGAVLFVSHDRSLVNQLSNKIVSIQNEQAVLVTGKTYEEFVAAEQQKRISATASWTINISVIMFCVINFILSIRAITRCSILISGKPQNYKVGKMDGLTAAKNAFISGKNHWMYGIRGLFFLTASLIWFLNAIIFMILTALISVYLITFRDIKRIKE
ncbi:MAG: DUF599 family protein [Promethearchaeia archaeon]